MTEAMAGLTELQSRIAQGDISIMRDAMGRALNNLWDEVAQYPEATAANAPGRFKNVPTKVKGEGAQFLTATRRVPIGYYERGRGWWYPVAQKKSIAGKKGVTLGQMTAAAAAKRVKFAGDMGRAVGYKLSGGGKSEALGRHWYMRVEITGQSVVGIIGNAASYARPVQGVRTEQSGLMRKIGWKSIEDVVNAQRESIVDGLTKATREFLQL